MSESLAAELTSQLERLEQMDTGTLLEERYRRLMSLGRFREAS